MPQAADRHDSGRPIGGMNGLARAVGGSTSFTERSRLTLTNIAPEARPDKQKCRFALDMATMYAPVQQRPFPDQATFRPPSKVMQQVSATDFRSQASKLFDAVERGERIVVLRHGKPIAEIRPIDSEEPRGPSWRRPGPRLVSDGEGLAATVLGERGREDVF
jgi:prevent-host-death family protein